MIIFDHKAGTLEDDGGNVISAHIWSGHASARNDASRVKEHGIGMIPLGDYEIGPLRDSPNLGRDVMNLDPIHGTNTFGRSLFRIHGDTANDFGFTASDGCIIAPHDVRLEVNKDLDRILRVL